MASFTRFFILLLPLIALFPLAVHSQGHTCVYCRSVTQEAPDPTASRIACTRNVNQSITCPVTGPMPDCDDQSLFQPNAGDLTDGCDSIEMNTLGAPVFRSYQCEDSVRFAGLDWGLRAVITDPACPDPGSIWTECSFSTPLCQQRKGIAASTVQGGLQVARENPATTAGVGMMAPAPEQEMPVAAGGDVLRRPAPAEEMPRATEQPLPGVTTSTPGGGGA